MHELQARGRVSRKPSPQGMPIDKYNIGTSAKPLTPSLSSAFRQTKSPLTPKVFGSSNASPTIPAKRGLHTESATSKGIGDGQSTPTFSGNITPRTAARKSRIGTESPSTPDGGSATRSPRPRSMVERDRPKDVSVGLGILSVGAHTSGSPAPGNASVGVRGPRPPRKSSGSINGPVGAAPATHFIQACDAKSAVSSPGADEKPKPGSRPAAFFYANEAASTQSDAGPRPVSRDKQDGGKRFIYANEHNSSQPPATKPYTAAKSISPSTASPRFPSPEVQRNGRPAQRPPSPLKDSSCTSAPVTLGSPRSKYVASPGKAASQESPLLPSSQLELNSRRTSLSSTTSALWKPAHRKSASTTSVQTTPTNKNKTPDARSVGFISPKGASTQQLCRSIQSPHSPDLSTSNSTSLVSTDTVPSSLILDTGQAMLCDSPLQSPTKSASRPHPPAEQLQKMNELAANARRERKVLDLEISNSSLLAINKTLEREMRKQSAELRRFRRISRSGRFSIATGSLRSMSGQSNLSALTENSDGRGDLSDLEEVSDTISEDSKSSEDDLESSFDDDCSVVLSPTSRADLDSRHRAKDEKRLMLDLSKHRQLLIDSQKMSQSIKRCLGWTEDLIKEGNRALAYNVKISDVELGGRVLSRDDEEEGVGAIEDVGESSKGLLSPSLAMNVLDDAKLWASALIQLDGEPEGTLVDEPGVLQPG